MRSPAKMQKKKKIRNQINPIQIIERKQKFEENQMQLFLCSFAQ